MPVERFHVGQTFRAALLIDRNLVDRFAALSGDTNPLHTDAEAARRYGHARPVAHGAILVGVLSRLIGTEVPGAGAVWMDQTIRWLRPVFVGDHVVVEMTIEAISVGAGILQMVTVATNQHGEQIMEGTARVKAPEPIAASVTGGEPTTALVTGGSRGIGAAIAVRLGRLGLDVAITYCHDKDAAEAVAERVRAVGRRASVHQVDFGHADACVTLAASVLDAHTRIDIVIHAATPRITETPVVDLTRSGLEEPWNVGVGAAVDLVRTWAPGMAHRRYGRFVFIGTSALEGTPPKGWAPYLTAKHALRGFSRSVAHELGHQGITCNLVSPSLTVTDLTSAIPARAKEVEARRNPMRRLATPEDTAAVVAFLVGPDAGFINGAELPVDGGMP